MPNTNADQFWRTSSRWGRHCAQLVFVMSFCSALMPRSFCPCGNYPATMEPPTMTLKRLFVAMPAALFILGNWPANAGQTINDVGAIACVNDKWDEKEV